MSVGEFQSRNYMADSADGRSEVTLLNHNGLLKEEPTYNMIMMNSILHNEAQANNARRLGHHQGSRRPNGNINLDRTFTEPDYMEQGDSVMQELMSHVKQINEELHQRHTAQEHEEQLKSEWRMVAHVLDRLLLILFFLMTIFTSAVIFVNIPH